MGGRGQALRREARVSLLAIRIRKIWVAHAAQGLQKRVWSCCCCFARVRRATSARRRRSNPRKRSCRARWIGCGSTFPSWSRCGLRSARRSARPFKTKATGAKPPMRIVRFSRPVQGEGHPQSLQVAANIACSDLSDHSTHGGRRHDVHRPPVPHDNNGYFLRAVAHDDRGGEPRKAIDGHVHHGDRAVR